MALLVSMSDPAHRPVRGGSRCWLALWTIAIGLLSLAASAAHSVEREYQIKGVLLYNLAHLAEWPEHAFGDSRDPLVIGVLGQDPFGEVLDRIVRDETVRGRPLVIRRLESAEEAGETHLLFIARSEKDRFREILAEVHDRPVLTVADSESFTRAGGMVEFFTTEEGRTRLRVHLHAIRAHDMDVSARLLRVAQVVTGGS